MDFNSLMQGMRFDEVVAYCKAHEAELKELPMGRAILKCIREGNLRRLKRFWLGAR